MLPLLTMTLVARAYETPVADHQGDADDEEEGEGEEGHAGSGSMYLEQVKACGGVHFDWLVVDGVSIALAHDLAEAI